MMMMTMMMMANRITEAYKWRAGNDLHILLLLSARVSVFSFTLRTLYRRDDQTVDRGQLFGLYQTISAASVRSIDLRLAAFLGSTYLCEKAFYQMKIIKSRYRSRLTDDHF
jgi:hypothetical protein